MPRDELHQHAPRHWRFMQCRHQIELFLQQYLGQSIAQNKLTTIPKLKEIDKKFEECFLFRISGQVTARSGLASTGLSRGSYSVSVERRRRRAEH